jgi:hypothetical protein
LPAHKLFFFRTQRAPNGRPNIFVPGASANVPAEVLGNFWRIRVDGTLHHAVDRHQPSRRAISALQRVLLLENLLHVIQSLGSIQPFEREDLRSIGLHRQQSAGARWLMIDHYCARAASAFSACDFQSREPEMIAQEIAQQETVSHKSFYFLSVYRDAQG